jgi:Mrp family chromosome partitioning ATPase
MSKIYEALERAEQIPHGTKLPDAMPPRSPWRRRLYIARRKEAEKGVVGFYQRVEALLPDVNKKVIQFVGSHRGEGTSTIVRQFAAISAFKMRKSVLVLDTDGINPTQHDLFNVHWEYSLDDVITDGGPIERAYCQVADPKLFVCLVSGNSLPPSQVLNGNGLWEMFRSRFDLVLIDSPPLEISSDSLAMVRKADGVILVIEAEKTRWPVVQNLRDSVIQYGGNVLGVVFNKQRYYVPGWIYKRL